ncbi:hypothetical protein MHBO_004965, partial [Bonamia ostreae]
VVELAAVGGGVDVGLPTARDEVVLEVEDSVVTVVVLGLFVKVAVETLVVDLAALVVETSVVGDVRDLRGVLEPAE